MKKLSANSSEKTRPVRIPASRGSAKLRQISRERLDGVFSSVGQKLRNGLSNEAERILSETIAGFSHSEDDLANLKRLLSFTLETVGSYVDSLEVLKPFENAENLEPLSVDTKVRVITQLAIAYSNLSDQPKAVTLLKENLALAQEHDLTRLTGMIFIGLSRVYRKLNEYPIARDFADKGLAVFREEGNWIGMAEAYREIALVFHLEGNSERSLEYFEQAIQIIGERSAPFMLGRLYTEMSGAFVHLRKPKEGIECLEKSIRFFERTEHILNSVIAYNNLGLNLLLIGNWPRAEEMISRALELASKLNHIHVAGILDSLGELKILKGELDEAETLLVRAVKLAKEKKHGWYTVQALRNLARCRLAKGEYEQAARDAQAAIDLAHETDDKTHANLAGLILAESYLYLKSPEACEEYLQKIEETDPSSDFFVLGSIQQTRGLAALAENDRELAVHHFYRSLTIFEAAEDLFHTALANFLIGVNLDSTQNTRAIRHLTTAGEIFKKLEIESYINSAQQQIAERQKLRPVEERPEKALRRNSVVSQLLMVRLAEATASRELLFRELVAILQQESGARKILIAQSGESGQMRPFITHAFSPAESSDIVTKFEAARMDNSEQSFLSRKDIGFFPLRPSNAETAYLLIAPRAGAMLNDESSLQPLLRVVELGMDVIALREKDRSAPIEREANAYTSNSLMPGFIHSSPAMTALVEEVYKIRSSDVTVLVTGESGTGKELVSRAIHAISNRKDKVFVPFNCTAVPKELAEGHLFGYRKGAFTGAVTDSPGMIRSADGGTLFLDEIGDLPIDVQPKMLRFLQEGEVQPIGEKRPIKVDVRVIAATNMPLEDKVADGSFREDLYYRLNVIRLRVPPLRERRSEIPPIVNYYVNHYSERFGKREVTFLPQTIDLLMVCEWEGNVRQLCNEIQRIIARAVDKEVITPDHLSPELKRTARPMATYDGGDNVRPIASYDNSFSFSSSAVGSRLEDAVGELETQMIKAALARHNWNISRVANELGLTRRGLYLKLERYRIEKAA
ncbi:MAG TPA: sigma 54-interacting transcriptional regulator [Pyrinomonadaceae bacterium]|nr:sigma 54-interacting transcriptional regulator [Pyrinomonadaceae bacterium]